MAIYHLSIKIGSRHGTKSSVAAAAYRAGQKLKDERSGKTYDYTNKKEVTYSEIILPENAPSFFSDRATLWNSVEGAEKQDNAQLYREFEIALPKELSREHQLQAAHEFFQRRAAEGTSPPEPPHNRHRQKSRDRKKGRHLLPALFFMEASDGTERDQEGRL